MAIAPLAVDECPGEVCGLLEVPWPRPVLRVVPPADDSPVARAGGRHPTEEGVPVVRVGEDVSARRRARRLVRARRHRAVAALAAMAAIVGLALPLSALGGKPVPAPSAPSGGGRVAGATVYVVQPGDTLWSIAARFDRGGDPRPLAEAIARETGSAVVVPGERLAIP